LSNVEAQWERLSKDDQVAVHTQLEALQKKDWKELSLDEKKAAYYVAFGPHGPRAPISPPGQNLKVFLATMGLVGAAGLLFLGIRAISPPPPRTITKEWEEAANERALEQKMNPISGISSEGYKGKGFVTHK
jgi:cytochrome c oxidase subunit 4